MPLTLTRRGWGFVLGAGVSALAASFAGLRDLWFLPVFLVAVPVLGVLAVLLMRVASRVETRVTAANPTPHAGSDVTLSATVSHRLPVAISARLGWQIGEEVSWAGLVLPARGGALTAARSTRTWHAEKRGPELVRVPAVVLQDPFGVAETTINCGELATVTGALVLPRLLTEAPERDGSQAVDRGALARSAPPATSASRLAQTSGTSGGALREYRPGDTKRMVDWKQSARQGDLVVRVAEPDASSARQLRISTSAADHASRHAFEDAVSEVATLAVRWLRRGDAVQLVVDDDAPIDGASEHELLRLLAMLELRSGSYGAG